MSALAALRISARPAALRINQFQRLSFTALNLARTYAGKSWPEHTVINMPALSPTMTQGSIISWAKSVGDQLQPGEAIAEIETDKASMDFEFQEDGYLAKILLEGGTKDIPVGKPIAVYVENKDDVPAFESFTAEDAGDASAAAPAAPAAEAPKEEKSTAAPSSSSSSSSSTSTKSAPAAGDRIIASPYAKTLALEKGISLKQVKGTGPNGRIIAKDVEAFKAPAPAAAAAPAASAPATASYEDVEITSMRRTIGRRLLESTQGAPTYIVSSSVSVSKLLKLRASLNSTAQDRYKLSVNDLMIKAIAVAAKRFPSVNSAWLENEGVIRQYKNVDVSVAVATPTGLITPIVKNAESKGLIDISHEIKELGKRAKENKLKPAEFTGGTITISNMGMNPAVSLFTSIINPPHSAIIAIATVEKVAVEDKSNPHGFSFDSKINLTGTFDHRTVDGALGGEFMKEVKRILENPLEFLL